MSREYDRSFTESGSRYSALSLVIGFELREVIQCLFNERFITSKQPSLAATPCTVRCTVRQHNSPLDACVLTACVVNG
jgi:hypothetical protein